MENRRSFIKKSVLGAAGASMAFSASSYARIIGANDRVHIAVAGLNGRGKALGLSALKTPGASVRYLCDVDNRQFSTFKDMLVKAGHDDKLKEVEDYRKLVEKKDLDAVAIATPEHWHAPMAIMAMQAGKHVYVEKPCAHNPFECELLVEAQKTYGKTVQMGNQQRSAPSSIQTIKDINNGIIGNPYYGKAWYSNSRGSIGRAQKTAVPDWLNWELWQGPAPRKDFENIWVHYNWHWNRNWGTGEIHNNGTHELDICRWALGVDYPNRVTSSGGRFHFEDDWQFYDTQLANFEFDGNKMISWEGKSCNPSTFFGEGRGAAIYGTEGYAILTRNGTRTYNKSGELIKELKEDEQSATLNTVGIGALDLKHMTNFIKGIQSVETLNAPIDDASISTMLCHLGNISQDVQRSLNIDPTNGRILKDEEAMKFWKREYEPGWELKV
ncbi:Gfo/Idh/MocA family protein [Marinoscillum sp. MHG1-6]|uniref:Gfo/Idh/MocA family protein n=1 Tax=Marinoscillum sp. MHG1-6 TaxID=2959627 RepID=UPI0021589F3E|nr:Gfo/Idh/MocA family oxidoreductase [Marinoscillum sp. MHG1-6]